jgi:hypothetical protein
MKCRYVDGKYMHFMTANSHLEEGKAARPTKGTKSGKAKQNDKEELRKAQDHKKLTKLKNST